MEAMAATAAMAAADTVATAAATMEDMVATVIKDMDLSHKKDKTDINLTRLNLVHFIPHLLESG